MAAKMTFLKKAKDYQPTDSLKFLLHSHLSGPEKERPLTNIHASELTKPDGLCPRYYALHDVTAKKPKDRWLSAADIVTYAMGTDLQDAIVHHFADMGRAVGHWKCTACGKVHQFCKRPGKCGNCGCKGFKPEEVRFQSAISGASCGVDMLVQLGGPKLFPVELKTMIKDQFAELVAPLQEHRLRTNLYLRLISESEQPWSNLVSTEEARVLYVCKGGYKADPELAQWGLPDKFSPFKEFKVKRDDTKTEEMAGRAKVVSDYRKGLIPMPCGVCKTAMVKRAQTCPMKSVCFSGEHPGVHEWQGSVS